MAGVQPEDSHAGRGGKVTHQKASSCDRQVGGRHPFSERLCGDPVVRTCVCVCVGGCVFRTCVWGSPFFEGVRVCVGFRYSKVCVCVCGFRCPKVRVYGERSERVLGDPSRVCVWGGVSERVCRGPSFERVWVGGSRRPESDNLFSLFGAEFAMVEMDLWQLISSIKTG